MQNCVVGYYVINHGVFAEEERVVIKFLRYNEGYSAGRLVKEFPLKKMENWRFEQSSEEK